MDYVFLDLEDAVAPGDKEQARRNVIQGLQEHDWRGRGKTICVRINGIDTHYMYRDVIDVVEQAGHRLDTILIPKVGVPADVYLVDALLTQIETARGFSHRIGIDVLIETALGMANVEAIAQASPRLEAMHFGVADYAASCRARTVVIGGLNPDYPGDQWHFAAVPHDRGVPGVRPPRRSTGRSATSTIPRGIPSPPSGARRWASRASGRSTRARSPWPTRSSLRRRRRSSGPIAFSMRWTRQPRRAGRGAARRPDDRRRLGPDGAERGQDGRRDRREVGRPPNTRLF